MFAKVHFGYRDGLPLAGVHAAPPIYGNMISERVRGLQVINLWPHTFPMNARTMDSKPLAALWRPHVSGFLEMEFGLNGLECRASGQWVAQRWLIKPMTFAEIECVYAQSS